MRRLAFALSGEELPLLLHEACFRVGLRRSEQELRSFSRAMRGSTGRATCCTGFSIITMPWHLLWSHIPATAVASFTSNIPRNEICNYLCGLLYIYTCIHVSLCAHINIYICHMSICFSLLTLRFFNRGQGSSEIFTLTLSSSGLEERYPICVARCPRSFNTSSRCYLGTGQVRDGSELQSEPAPPMYLHYGSIGFY